MAQSTGTTLSLHGAKRTSLPIPIDTVDAMRCVDRSLSELIELNAFFPSRCFSRNIQLPDGSIASVPLDTIEDPDVRPYLWDLPDADD